jgi:hypothetical protein
MIFLRCVFHHTLLLVGYFVFLVSTIIFGSVELNVSQKIFVVLAIAMSFVVLVANQFGITTYCAYKDEMRRIIIRGYRARRVWLPAKKSAVLCRLYGINLARNDHNQKILGI